MRHSNWPCHWGQSLVLLSQHCWIREKIKGSGVYVCKQLSKYITMRYVTVKNLPAITVISYWQEISPWQWKYSSLLIYVRMQPGIEIAFISETPSESYSPRTRKTSLLRCHNLRTVPTSWLPHFIITHTALHWRIEIRGMFCVTMISVFI